MATTFSASRKRRDRALEMVQHWDDAHQGELRKLLQRYEVLAEAQSTVQGFLGTACTALEQVPECHSRTALEGLTRFLSQQTSQLGV